MAFHFRADIKMICKLARNYGKTGQQQWELKILVSERSNYLRDCLYYYLWDQRSSYFQQMIQRLIKCEMIIWFQHIKLLFYFLTVNYILLKEIKHFSLNKSVAQVLIQKFFKTYSFFIVKSIRANTKWNEIER